MEISVNSNTVTITGNIKKVSDFQSIKNSIEPIVQNNNRLVVKILDSLSLTSTTIGYLNKLVLKDNINIQVMTGNDKLYDLLEDLNLISTFKVKRV